MKYVIIRTARGKNSVVDEGSLSKMNNRLKQLRSSTTRGVCGRGHKKYKATYKIETAEAVYTITGRTVQPTATPRLQNILPERR